MTTHLIDAERKQRNSPVIVVWARCGQHEPWAEWEPDPSKPRGFLRRRLYSATFRPNLRPKDSYVTEDHEAFANCPGCLRLPRSNRPQLRPEGQAIEIRRRGRALAPR